MYCEHEKQKKCLLFFNNDQIINDNNNNKKRLTIYGSLLVHAKCKVLPGKK